MEELQSEPELTYEQVCERLEVLNENASVWDGYEDALIGYMEDEHHNQVALYDENACLRILMNRDGMEYQEALDFYETNTNDSYFPHRPRAAVILRKAPASDTEWMPNLSCD